MKSNRKQTIILSLLAIISAILLLLSVYKIIFSLSLFANLDNPIESNLKNYPIGSLIISVMRNNIGDRLEYFLAITLAFITDYGFWLAIYLIFILFLVLFSYITKDAGTAKRLKDNLKVHILTVELLYFCYVFGAFLCIVYLDDDSTIVTTILISCIIIKLIIICNHIICIYKIYKLYKNKMFIEFK